MNLKEEMKYWKGSFKVLIQCTRIPKERQMISNEVMEFRIAARQNCKELNVQIQKGNRVLYKLVDKVQWCWGNLQEKIREFKNKT